MSRPPARYENAEVVAQQQLLQQQRANALNTAAAAEAGKNVLPLPTRTALIPAANTPATKPCMS